MTGVRILVGTRKGAFVLSSDGARKDWKIDGPFFTGWEVYHIKGSPVDPNRIYATQTLGWFGQVTQRSDDGGKTWNAPGGGVTQGPDGMPKGESNRFVYDTSEATGKPLTTHKWYDGGDNSWDFARVWHFEPSLHDPDTVYAGVEDAALFRSTDGAHSWHELAGLRGHETGSSWMPGAGGLCLHTIIQDPSNAKRLYVAISAAGAFRTDDGGGTWQPINRGLQSPYLPEPKPEIGFCVHRLAIHPSHPNVVYMQLHQGGGVYRTENAGDEWVNVNGNLPTDFGFPIDVHAHEPKTVYVIPINAFPGRFPPDGQLRVYRSKVGGNEWEPLTKGLPQKNCYVNVLRDAMSVDSLDECGVYFGTTGGQVYASADGGDSWNAVVQNLPSVLSVEAQTLR